MSKTKIAIFIIIIFAVFWGLYYNLRISFVFVEDIKIFLTVSSFLFAIFAGFFISRQGRRYLTISQAISKFDGDLSHIYRSSGNFDQKMKKQIGQIISKHYQQILKNKSWDYHLNHKSTTLTDLHATLKKNLDNKQLSSFKNQTLNRMMAALLDAQIARKNMIFLYYERIPKVEWAMIYILAIILLITLSYLDTQYIILASFLKAAFATAVIHVLILLHQLNKLNLYEEGVGENSAKDIIDIIKQK